MFGILLSKEIREHLMTFRFGAALVTTFILVVISVWILGDEFVKEKEGFENLSSSFNLAIRAATTPSQISPVVMRPLSPLSIFAQGPGSNMGNTVSISRWSVPTRATNEIKNNLLLSSMPSFDLLTIFIFVLSLFGILFSYDGFSGEREKGTLKILCTYPPSRSMLFTVKFTGCLIVISIPFLISFISALLILIFVHGISFSASHFLAIALILFSSLVYSCIFIGLGLLSSATTAKSSSSLALSLLIWTFLVVLIPGTSQGLARMTSPLLPADEIIVSSEKSKEELNLRVGEYIKENHIRFGPSYGDNGYGKENSYLLDTTPYFFRQMQGYVSFIEKINQERADQVYSLKQKHLDVEKSRNQ